MAAVGGSAADLGGALAWVRRWAAQGAARGSPAAVWVLAAVLVSWLATGLGGSGVALARAGDEVGSVAVPQRSVVRPGERLAVAVRVTIEEGWHIWPDQAQVKIPDGVEDLVPVPSTLRVAGELPPGVRVHLDRVQWPKPVLLETKAGLETTFQVLLYKGTVRVYVPVSIAPDAKPGEAAFTLAFGSQACNDVMCARPTTAKLPVKLTIVAADSPAEGAPASADPAEFEGFDAKVLAGLGAGGAGAAGGGSEGGAGAGAAEDGVIDFGAFGIPLRINTKGALGPVLVVLVAFLGGMVLNLTPCVLPVIPLKILSLQASAGSRSRLMLLGGMTALGVVLFWVVLGAIISAGALLGVSRLASFWQFNLGLALFIGFMAVGMLGAWSAGLPDWVYNISPDNKSAPGALGFGVLTAVLGTPCIAPFAGTALAWSAKQPGALNMAMFLAIGLGMALPYFLLSINPRWLSFLPRAGPASDLLKKMMGMLMLAVAVFFLGTGMLSLLANYPWLGRVLHWWAVAGVLAAAAVWLVVATVRITPSLARRGGFGLIGVAVAAAGVWWAEGESAAARAEHAERAAMEAQAAEAGGQVGGLWRPFTRAALDREIAAGKVVVLDFTAEWCLTCKALEKAVLRRDAVREALAAPGVVSFKADVTADEAPGWKLIEELKQPGIPLLVIWGPGLDKPWESTAYTVSQVLDTIAKARGTPAAAAVAGPSGGR